MLRFVRRTLIKLSVALSSLYRELVLSLPDEYSKFRVAYYNRQGCKIARLVSLSPNVRIRGHVEIGEGSSVAQNGTITGLTAGVRIGRNVMIAPNVVIVAFSHGAADNTIPMVKQQNIEAPVIIEDDVWVGANVTIGKGVTIGRGAIVAANSFVRSDVEPMTLVCGVPAAYVRKR